MKRPKETVNPNESQSLSGASKGGASQPEGSVVGNERVSLDNPDEIKKQYPQLSGLVDSLLGDYTKKTQQIARVRNKANAFDELVQDPSFKAFASQHYGIGDMGGMPAKPNEQESLDDELDIDTEFMDENTKKILDHYKKTIAGLRSQVGSLTRETAKQRNDRLIAGLTAKYPDFEEKLPELYPLIKQGLPMEVAYLQKFGNDLVERKVQEQLEAKMQTLTRESTGSILPNAGIGGGDYEASSEDIKSIRDAITSAQQELSSKVV